MNYDARIQMSAFGNQLHCMAHFGNEQTGIYGGNVQVQFAADGINVLNLQKTVIGALVPIQLPADPTTTMQAATKQYVDNKPAADVNKAYVDAADGARVLKAGDTMTGNLTIPGGTAAAPSLNFTGGTNCGLYGGSGALNFSVGGAAKLLLSSSAITPAIPIRGFDGTVNAPQYAFNSASNTGILRSATELAFAWAGVQKLGISATLLTSTLPLVLPADPTTALQAVTKQYVDGRPTGLSEAPGDGTFYARRNLGWGRVAPTQGALFGLGLNNYNDNSSTITVGSGYATSTIDQAYLMVFGGMTKPLTPWAAGNNNGCMLTTVMPDTWYDVYVIGRVSDGAVDFSVNTPGSGGAPSGWDHSRRIGSVKTVTTGIKKMRTFGDYFYWPTPILDKLLTTHNPYAETWTISVPPQYGTVVLGTLTMQTGAAGAGHTLFSTLWMDYVGSLPDDGSVQWLAACGANGRTSAPFEIPCNGSSISSIHSTTNNDTVRIWTRGWIDYRGTRDFPIG
jgi:hypothetical protein